MRRYKSCCSVGNAWSFARSSSGFEEMSFGGGIGGGAEPLVEALDIDSDMEV